MAPAIICHSVMVHTVRLVLLITEKEMEENNELKPQAVIEVIENGPIRITGNFLISDSKRDIMDSPLEVLLCRCGKSQNKPYCDDSHKK